jgi:sulfofructosephosphate aldolase
VSDFNKLCDAANLPSIIEIIVKPPNDSSREFNREEELVSAAKEASKWKLDLYKAEVPFHGEGDLNRVRKNAELITDAIGKPWVVLSNGVKAEFFADAVKACSQGGASGFLAGRAVWADLVGSPNIPVALRNVAIPRLKKLSEVVDTYARPWDFEK